MAHFFFGTMKDRDVLDLVIGRPVADADVAPATLAGFRLVRVVDESYPGLAPTPNGRARGLLVRGFSPRDLERLAWFEGAEYGPHAGEVTLGDGSRVTATVHLPNETLDVYDETWEFERWRRTEKPTLMTLTRAHMALMGRISVVAAAAIWDQNRERMQERRSLGQKP